MRLTLALQLKKQTGQPLYQHSWPFSFFTSGDRILINRVGQSINPDFNAPAMPLQFLWAS